MRKIPNLITHAVINEKETGGNRYGGVYSALYCSGCGYHLPNEAIAGENCPGCGRLFCNTHTEYEYYGTCNTCGSPHINLWLGMKCPGCNKSVKQHDPVNMCWVLIPGTLEEN